MTPQKIEDYASLAVAYIDQNFRNYFSGKDCRLVIAQTSLIAANDETIGRWPGNLVSEIFVGACAYGSLDLQPSDSDSILEVRNALAQISNPMHLLGTMSTDDFDMLMHIFGREQLGFQDKISSQELGRYRWLMCLLPDVEFDQLMRTKIGCDLESLIKATTYISAFFLNQPTEVPRHKIDSLLAGVGISTTTLDVLLLILSTTIIHLNNDYHEKLQSTDPKTYFWARKAPFLTKPIIGLDGENLICPFPNLIGSALYRFLGNKIRKDDRTRSHFTSSFAKYSELLLDDLNPDEITYPDLETQTDKRCDFLCKFAEGEIYVESKATRFSHDNLFPDAFVTDTSSRQIADAVIQISSSKTGNDAKPYGIILIDDKIHLTNSEWYWSKLAECENAIPSARDEFNGPILIWTHRDLELAIMLCNATSRSFRSLLDEYCEEPRQQKGDWSVWLQNRFSNEPDLHISSIEWIRLAAKFGD